LQQAQSLASSYALQLSNYIEQLDQLSMNIGFNWVDMPQHVDLCRDKQRGFSRRVTISSSRLLMLVARWYPPPCRRGVISIPQAIRFFSITKKFAVMACALPVQPIFRWWERE